MPSGIWVLGFVSLLMDISSEMIHSLLPLFMVTTLGAGTVAVGIVEGLAESLALLVKIFSGVLSEYVGRRKPLVLFGYGLSALTKPLFALAPDIGSLLAARVLDRVGKGIRGAPRDALVADIAPPHLRGAAFGLRQSLDTVGAILGPLLAVGLMLLWSDDFRSVFWVAVIPGIMAVLLAAALLGGESFLGHMRMLGGPYGWVLRTVVFGFTFLFMQNIIHTTTSDEKAPLEFPDATEFFSGAFSLGLTVLMSFGLPIGLGIARIFGVEIPGAAILATMIIGFAYFPMALLAVAMKDNPLAANPLVVIPAILKIPVEYGITAIILLSAYGLRQLGDMIAMAAGGVAFSTKDTNVLMIALVSQAAIAVGGVYLLTVCGRVLGLLYNRKKRELAWFSH